MERSPFAGRLLPPVKVVLIKNRTDAHGVVNPDR